MNLQFFCKVVNKDNDQYTIELDFTNKLNIPINNLTTRKVSCPFDLDIGSIIFVSKSSLHLVEDDVKKLTITEAYTIDLISTKTKLSNLENLLSEDVKVMIKDSNRFPIHILS